MTDETNLDVDESMGARARGGAAVGAGFGAMIGAVAGWLMGAQVTTVPTIGPVVGDWVLPSMLVGLGAGAAIGALIGALAAVSTMGRRQAEIADESAGPEMAEAAGASEMAWLAGPEWGDPTEAILEAAPDALDSDDAAAGDLDGVGAVAATGVALAQHDVENDGPLSASIGDEATSSADVPVANAEMEATSVNDEQEGRNPNTFTGTEDAVDSGTGAVGTAGTPVTTGYGVSGSTVGTGTRRRRKKQEQGEYRGATPESVPYDVGGRGTGDSGVLEGAEREAPVAEAYSDSGQVEASVPRDTEGRDVYEQSDGYAENLERDQVNLTSSSSANESAGTNIPGTDDPRGLGDNTDETGTT